jgi:hypothetical protein
MPPAVGIVIAPLRRDRHDYCLRLCARSRRLAQGARVRPSRWCRTRPLLLFHLAQRGQMHQGRRKSRQAAWSQRAQGRLVGDAPEINSNLGSEALPGSVPSRALAADVDPRRRVLGHVSHVAGRISPPGEFGDLRSGHGPTQRPSMVD